EAARALGRRIMDEGGETIDDRLTYGFRLVTARRPREAELAALRDFHDAELRRFRADPASATALVESDVTGMMVPDAPVSDDVAAAAAWTIIGSVLLNLDETVTKG
ncbi:MAG: hypothetical protein KDA25_05820, partial [Phycisphaerales bacterium]|nr:hypothetical protein [Phycisphaerales bacterium]